MTDMSEHCSLVPALLDRPKCKTKYHKILKKGSKVFGKPKYKTPLRKDNMTKYKTNKKQNKKTGDCPPPPGHFPKYKAPYEHCKMAKGCHELIPSSCQIIITKIPIQISFIGQYFI